jgi:mannosyltransferase OCH1-like enzyme
LSRNSAGYNDTSRGARITKIIHQTWKTASIPKVAVNWIRKWQKTNPDWEYWFWTDKDVEKFFEKKYPQFLNLYKYFPRSHAAIQRADIMRYFILYEYGGVYADLDLEPLKSLNPITANYPCIFSEEPEEHSNILRPNYRNEYGALVCNAFIACRPGHPFMKYIIDHLQQNINKTLKAKSVMYSTGPAMVSILHADYIKSRPDLCHNERHRVIIADSKYFMAIYDGSQTPKLAYICSTKENLPEFRSKACERLIRRMFQNRPAKDSYTVHHWFHTWTPKGKKYLPEKGHPAVDIKTVLPNAKLVRDMYGFL